jgi:L-aspartate oxidase
MVCRVFIPSSSAENLLHLAYDVLIIGSGLAGMSAALHLAQKLKVALVTKHELLDGASSWAQGGIAAVLDQSDSLEDHVRDTHVAGAGLCHDDAVRFVVERGRRSVEWLVAQGVPFTRDGGNPDELHLTREGGHSHRII